MCGSSTASSIKGHRDPVQIDESGFAAFVEHLFTPDEMENEQFMAKSLNVFGIERPARESGWIAQSLVKGYQLAKAGYQWEQPVAGGGTERITKARGEQWRLVMTWGGFETVSRVFTGNQTNAAAFGKLLDKCDLPPMKPIPGPKIKSSSLERWLNYKPLNRGDAVLDYLGLTHKGVLEAATNWFVHGRDLKNWSETVELARAIRHATAHGSLSASKVHEWRTTKTCSKLSETLWQLVNRIFNRLSDSIRYPKKNQNEYD